MPKINILPKSVAELIAAGEVVERPASAMKELIENAIDAGSKRITVEIRSGGIAYMRVTDDGCGIFREDVPLAFRSHATSKVQTPSDLNAIYTLGFRGEALASIAAVSKTEILTKAPEEPLGTRCCVEGGTQVLLDDAGCPNGTTVVVRELFYNTPARMKFLKKDSTEGNYVSDVVVKCAMAHPEISFRFIKDGKQTIFTPGSGKLLSAVSTLLGKDFAAAMLETRYELNGVGVNGLVGSPRFGKPTRNSQYFFVNARYVKAPVAVAALDEAYKNSIMVGKFPAAVLNITIPPETVDVNVHPAKTEVRFSDEKRIFEAVYYAAKSAIEALDVRPSLRLSPDVPSPEPKGEQVGFFIAELPKEKAMRPSVTVSSKDENGKSYSVTVHSTPEESAPPEPDTQRKADRLESGRETRENYAARAERPAQPPSEPPKDAPAQNGETLRQEKAAAPPSFIYVGELFHTYLVVQLENAVWLIDKHALHERILFNELKSHTGSAARQFLLAPLTVQPDRREYAAVCEHMELFRSLGFDIEDFGDGCLIVRACPLAFTEDDLSDVIAELAGGLLEHRSDMTTRKLERMYETAACRAAIKGGSVVTKLDAETLIERLLADDSLRYCPHGRPVMIELTRRELEKQFGRIQ